MAPKPRFNPWPYGIVVAFVVFVALVGTLVSLAVRNPAQLVARDYYEQELRYQDLIDRRTRAQGLVGGLQIESDGSQNRITLRFPVAQVRQGIQGTLRMYRPSDAGLDQAIPLAPDAEGLQQVETRQLAAGLWQLRVEWRCGEESFFKQEPVRIPRRAS